MVTFPLSNIVPHQKRIDFQQIESFVPEKFYLPFVQQLPILKTLSLATHNRFGQARSIGACAAPRELLFALNGIFIHSV
jgi:hypothetical protein